MPRVLYLREGRAGSQDWPGLMLNQLQGEDFSFKVVGSVHMCVVSAACCGMLWGPWNWVSSVLWDRLISVRAPSHTVWRRHGLCWALG